jgi:hypothetical protein
MLRQAVKYQGTPKGEQPCEICALFEAPPSCKNVDGIIAAQALVPPLYEKASIISGFGSEVVLQNATSAGSHFRRLRMRNGKKNAISANHLVHRATLVG